MVSQVAVVCGIVAVVSGVGVFRAVVRSGLSTAFNEICAVVVLNKNSVQMLDFVCQPVV